MPNDRPVAWPTDEQFVAVIAKTHRPADRLLLLALRLHDPYGDSKVGAIPSGKRLAALTGLSYGYVRQRLAVMASNGTIATQPCGRLTRYSIVSPVPVKLAKGRTMPKRIVTAPLSSDDDNTPAYDANGKPAAWLTQMAAEAWTPRKSA